MDETALSTGTVESPATEHIATTTDVEEAATEVVTAAAASDAAIIEAVDDLSETDAALATWMGDLDEKVDRQEIEMKGLREWATQFQASVSAALEGHGNILSQIQDHLTTKSETPQEKKEGSPSEKTEKAEVPEERKEPENQKVPLMEESAGARKKKIDWI